MLVFNYLYDLPFFKNRNDLSGKLLGGWQISGITQFQTGLPCSIAGATDYAGVGLDSNFGCGVNGQFWVVNGDPKIIGTFGPQGQWFATTNPDGTPIFTKPTAGTFNTQRVRNLIYQPGYQNWNLGLFKNFAIDEQIGFQFRAEAFNFINHPNWCGGSGCNGTTNMDSTPLTSIPSGRCSPREVALAAASAICSSRCGSISRELASEMTWGQAPRRSARRSEAPGIGFSRSPGSQGMLSLCRS